MKEMQVVSRVPPILLFCALLVQAGSLCAEEDAATVLAGARQHWAGYRSIVLHARHEFRRNDEPWRVAGHTLSSAEYEFSVEGSKFRTDFRNFDDGNRNYYSSSYTSNNGTYQHYDPTSQSLTENSILFNERLPYGAKFDLFDPLDFACIGSSANFVFTDIQSDDLWNSLAQTAQIMGTDNWNDKECTVVQFQSPTMMYEGSAYRVMVYFSKPDGFYPIRYTRLVDPEGWVIEEFSVEELATVTDADGESYLIPVRTVNRGRGARDDVPIIITKTTNLETLKVNSDIDDDLFTIPLGHVRMYEDLRNPSRNWDVAVQEEQVLSSIVNSADKVDDTPPVNSGTLPGHEPKDGRVDSRDAKSPFSYGIMMLVVASIVTSLAAYRFLKQKKLR